MTSKTKYAQIYDYLFQKIRTGQYPTPGKLESETELCDRFSASRPTVRQALQMLEQEGLVYRRRGSGTYVRTAPAAPILSAKRGQYRRVGLIVPTSDFSPYIELSEAIEQLLAAHGYSVLLRATNYKTQAEREILTEFADVGVDGIVVYGTRAALPNFNTDLYEQLRLSGIACVFLNETYAELALPTVTLEDADATEQFVRYLVSLGHRTISCLFAIDSVRGHSRYTGYLRGLRDARLEFSDDLVCWYTAGEEEAAVEAYRSDRATACICQNDRTARLLIGALEARGVHVPGDVSVVSMDGVDTETEADALTMATCSVDDISRAAVDTLLQAMQGLPAGSVSLPMALHVGNTSAPSKKRNPVISGNWANPFVLKTDSGFYLYPTRRWADSKFYVFQSDNLLHWSMPKQILDLRDVPWATESAWSPSVLYYGGMYYMAYNANRQIGIASSTSPAGPFESLDDTPFIEHTPDGIGLPIDPHLFLHNGRPYLLYGMPKCWMVPLDISARHVSLGGEPICLSSRLLNHDGSPFISDKSAFNGATRLHHVRGRYLLTWSCYDTRDPRCQISYAWADTLEGPFVAPENNVLLKGSNGIVGTGHGCVIEQGDDLYLFYHRLANNRMSHWQEMYREVCLDPIEMIDRDTLIVRPTP